MQVQDAASFDFGTSQLGMVQCTLLENMHPRANHLDPRSPCLGLSSVYLCSFLLLSAASVGEGLITTQAASAYPELAASAEESQPVQVSLIESSELEDAAPFLDELQPDSEQISSDDFDRTLPLPELENNSELDRSIEIESSSIPVESDLRESDEPVAVNPAAIDPTAIGLEASDLQVVDLEVADSEVTQLEVTQLEVTPPDASISDQIMPVVDASEQPESYLFAELENAAETDATLLPTLEVAQMPDMEEPIPESIEQSDSDVFDNRWQAHLQGVYILEGDESSARARLTASYAFTPNILVGTTIDLVGGEAFTSNPEEGFNLQELFLTVAPSTVPGFRVTLGMIDLTSYFDRNSFAKDAATQFFNPVFQTNPALVAAGIGSQPGVLVNWDVTDNFSVRGAAFSSDRDLDDFAFDAAAAEVAFRFGTAIIRGTYSNSRDAGNNTGFDEIFQFDRGDDDFGLEPGDREIAYGVNAEVFIPELSLGLFGRYGWYQNETLDEGGNTFSFGLNALDLFFADDRLGVAYGQNLYNASLRDDDDEIPDVVELFYDVRVLPYLRLGVTLQALNEFSETIAGFRIRGDLDLADLWR